MAKTDAAVCLHLPRRVIGKRGKYPLCMMVDDDQAANAKIQRGRGVKGYLDGTFYGNGYPSTVSSRLRGANSGFEV